MTSNNFKSKSYIKKQHLQKIEDAINYLESSPLYAYRLHNNFKPVIGEGNLDAEIVLIGEAPGEKEALSGRPFVGRAGEVLNELLSEINLNRDDVYITNIVKDRPPHNRDPRVSEIELYAPYLIEQIKIIKPQVIVTLGRFAMNFILKQFSLPEYGRSIGDLHGQLLKAETPYGNFNILPLYHPAAMFYNRSLEETLHQDFQGLSRFVWAAWITKGMQ